MDPQQYYGAKGQYLDEHCEYFSKKQLEEDADFLIRVLKLSKKDKILDLACGHGRHTIELKRRGYDIDGLDFSKFLLKTAEEQATKKNLKINFYQSNVHNVKLKKKYDKIFLFFSEFGLFKPDQVLKNINKILKKGGLFLLDYDNVFRLIRYLAEHPKAPYTFDFVKMQLKGKNKNYAGVISYYTIPDLITLFLRHKLKIVATYGNYRKEKLNIRSKRTILIGKKK